MTTIKYKDMLGNPTSYDYCQNPYDKKPKIETFQLTSTRQAALICLAKQKLGYCKRIFEGFQPEMSNPFVEGVEDNFGEKWEDKVFLKTTKNGEIEYYYQSEIRPGLHKITFH